MYLVFDTETTGLPANFYAPITDSVNWPRLVELAWSVFGKDGTLRGSSQLLIRPEGFAIPAEATQIHSITTEQATAEGVPLAEALKQLIAAADGCQYLVAHNIEYDLAILRAELYRLGQPWFGEKLQLVCTMGLGTSHTGQDRKPPKLQELHQALFREPIRDAHRAGVDVAACARCLFELLSRGVSLPAAPQLIPVAPALPEQPALPLDLENQEFQQALDLIENTNRSVFLTGKAGTGKSTFLRYIKANTRKRALVVAPTGVAALNAGGMTIHRAFGLPLGIMQPQDIRVPYFGPNRYTGEFVNKVKYDLLQAVELVIIDEVSMVRADILDAIDRSLRLNSRRLKEPFGGKQVLLVGDAYQLPPVLTATDAQLFGRFYQTRYFFGAQVFTRFPLITVELRKAYRQQEPDFIRLLDRVRTNEADTTDLAALNARVANTEKAAGRSITLSTRNKDAEEHNAGELNKLMTPMVKYQAVVTGDFIEGDFPTARELVLKEGAQVMFVRNDRGPRWVNGTLGRVVKLEKRMALVETEHGATYSVEADTWEKFVYSFDEAAGRIVGSVVGTFTQLPLKLAWALTVHKSQGLTFDAVEVNAPTGFFDAGQLYVALSRCRSFEGLRLRTPVRGRDVMVSREVIELHRTANDEQQVMAALEEARPNKAYQQSLRLLDEGNIPEAVSMFCEALTLRNDASKPVFGRLLRHKLHRFARAEREVVGHVERNAQLSRALIETVSNNTITLLELADARSARDEARSQLLQEQESREEQAKSYALLKANLHASQEKLTREQLLNAHELNAVRREQALLQRQLAQQQTEANKMKAARAQEKSVYDEKLNKLLHEKVQQWEQLSQHRQAAAELRTQLTNLYSQNQKLLSDRTVSYVAASIIGALGFVGWAAYLGWI